MAVEERDDRMELISEISDASDLAPLANQMAGMLEAVLATPGRSLRELRRS